NTNVASPADNAGLQADDWSRLVTERRRAPEGASLECEARLTATVSPFVSDMLQFRLPYQVVNRGRLTGEGIRDRFIAERSNRTVPLRQNEVNALRSLGYVR